MSWLRLDDDFMSHPKFEGWTVSQKWALLELFGYCARHKTEGHVPDDLLLLPRPVTRKLIERAESSGWLDRDADGLVVHDWEHFNPSDATNAERQARWREKRRKRNATRNAVSNASSVTETVISPLPTRARIPSPKELTTTTHPPEVLQTVEPEPRDAEGRLVHSPELVAAAARRGGGADLEKLNPLADLPAIGGAT